MLMFTLGCLYAVTGTAFVMRVMFKNKVDLGEKVDKIRAEADAATGERITSFSLDITMMAGIFAAITLLWPVFAVRKLVRKFL